MNDFTTPIKKAINSQMKSALVLGAHELNRLSDRFTPVWRGNLQRSKRVKVESPTVVYAVSGNARTEKYLFAQYYEPLRHRGDFSSGLKDLTALYRDGGTSKKTIGGSNTPRRPSRKKPSAKLPEVKLSPRRTGRGKKYLYSRAYRMARKNGQLNKSDAPKWYERALDDAQISEQIGEVVAGRLNI